MVDLKKILRGNADLSSALGRKLLKKQILKDSNLVAAGLNQKYTEAAAPDAVADVERSARGASRTMQRQVKTGRSSTILSMREGMGMDAIARPNTQSVDSMEGGTKTSILENQRASEMTSARDKFIKDAEAKGIKVTPKFLLDSGVGSAEDQAAFDAKKKKKSEMKKIIRIGGI